MKNRKQKVYTQGMTVESTTESVISLKNYRGPPQQKYFNLFLHHLKKIKFEDNQKAFCFGTDRLQKLGVCVCMCVAAYNNIKDAQ